MYYNERIRDTVNVESGLSSVCKSVPGPADCLSDGGGALVSGGGAARRVGRPAETVLSPENKTELNKLARSGRVGIFAQPLVLYKPLETSARMTCDR